MCQAQERSGRQRRLAICMAAMIGYGIYLQSGSTYAILVISVTAIVTGLAGGIHPDRLFEVMIEGASKMMWLFYYVCLLHRLSHSSQRQAHSTHLVKIIEPLLHSNSKVIVALVTALTGIFGVGGAAAAQSVVMDSMFKELVTAIGMSTGLWATILLVGSQITSFAYPEADMMGQMGLARSKDLKNMVKFGITITAVTVIYVGIRAMFG